MDRIELKKLAKVEAELLEKEIRSTYNTRIGVKQMITKGIMRFYDSIKDDCIEPNDDLCIICDRIPVDIAQFDTCKGCEIA